MTDTTATVTAVPPTASRKTVRYKSPTVRGRLPVLILFLPPALLLFTVFVILPMGRALINNGIIIFVSVLLQIPLALWLAMMLAQRIAGVVAFRLIFFLPYVLADVAAGLIWRFVYDGDYGLVAAVAGFFGVATPYVLADRSLAIYAVLAVIIWKYFGFHMMLFIAGLQAVDRSVLEAAEIDGATGWQKFRYVTLPLLGSTVRLSISSPSSDRCNSSTSSCRSPAAGRRTPRRLW